ncbi:skin secretory protein xP2-like [Branchiostoma lanceolatum]|uniref:skin secretory protein xP2-like n=1 Tax=Branchiostoma lanceolatum TaxID=7740 RepID=UPI001132ED5B
MQRWLVLLLALCLAAVHVSVAQSPVPAEGGSPPEAPQSPEAPAAEDVEGTDAEEDVGDAGTDAPDDGTDAPGEGTAAPMAPTTAAPEPEETTPAAGCAAIVANSLLVFSTAALLLTRQ